MAGSALDDALVRALNRLALATPAGLLGTRLAARWLAGVEVGLMVLLAASGRRPAAGRMLLGVGVVYVTCDALGWLWPRRRPFDRLADITPLVPHTSGRSFPSRHVASGLAMAAAGAAAQPGLGLAMRWVAWLLGLSRVMAGLHYPSDVLCGALLGHAVAGLLGHLAPGGQPSAAGGRDRRRRRRSGRRRPD